MKQTTALIIAAGFVAVAGVALADQSVVVHGNVHTPAGDYPVEYQASGLPTDQADVPLSQQVDDGNAQLAENGVPFELQMQERGVRANVRCSVEGAPPEACITDEPTIEYPQTDYLTVGPDGVSLTDWIRLNSGQAFQFVPEQVPEDQRAQLEQANDAVNTAVETSIQDGTGDGSFGGFIRVPGASGEVGGSMDDPFGGHHASDLLSSEGREALLNDAGTEQFFNANPAPLPGTDGGDGAGALPESGNVSPDQGPDLGAMALAAAAIGGAIMAPLALYHRIRSNHTLNNKTRQKVYDSVVSMPGIGVSEAAKAAGCSYSTGAYHLERLVEERLLIASEDGRRARFFKNGGAFSQQEREFVPVLQSDECMRVLQVIVENPWCYRAEIAQKLSVSGPTVNWHLKRLMGVGAVKEMREGRISYLYADKKLLTEVGANLIGKVQPELVDKLRFEHKPQAEFVEPAASLPETGVPEVGMGELDMVELAPIIEPN